MRFIRVSYLDSKRGFAYAVRSQDGTDHGLIYQAFDLKWYVSYGERQVSRFATLKDAQAFAKTIGVS